MLYRCKDNKYQAQVRQRPNLTRLHEGTSVKKKMGGGGVIKWNVFSS